MKILYAPLHVELTLDAEESASWLDEGWYAGRIEEDVIDYLDREQIGVPAVVYLDDGRMIFSVYLEGYDRLLQVER